MIKAARRRRHPRGRRPGAARHEDFLPISQAQSANPDVIVFLTQGDDMVNALKQAVQFGLESEFTPRARGAGAVED